MKLLHAQAYPNVDPSMWFDGETGNVMKRRTRRVCLQVMEDMFENLFLLVIVFDVVLRRCFQRFYEVFVVLKSIFDTRTRVCFFEKVLNRVLYF